MYDFTTTPTFIPVREAHENHVDAEKDEIAKIRAILDSQKPWHEYSWHGSTDPIIMSLAH